MSNFKINNINNSLTVNHQNSSKNFKSGDSNYGKYTDRELYEVASFVPDKKLSNVAQNAVKTFLIAVPAIDIAVSAFTKKGALASKVKNAAVNSAFWATAFASAAAVFKTKKAVNKNSQLLDDFNKKHRVTSTFIDFAVVFAAFKGAINGINKIGSIVKENLPEKTQIINNKVVKPLKTFLNNSLVNKKLVQPLENYFQKNSVASKAIKTTARLTVPTVMLATILRFAVELNKRNENVENNFYILKAINQNYIHQTDEDKLV